nr:hypothetical protein [Sinorhizobium sp. M4_45]
MGVNGRTTSQIAEREAMAKPAAHQAAARPERLFTEMITKAATKIWATMKFTASSEIAPPMKQNPICARDND